MSWWERAVTFAAAILLMTPEVITSIIGIGIGVGVLLLDVIIGKSKKAKPEDANKTLEMSAADLQNMSK